MMNPVLQLWDSDNFPDLVLGTRLDESAYSVMSAHSVVSGPDLTEKERYLGDGWVSGPGQPLVYTTGTQAGEKVLFSNLISGYSAV